MARKLLDENGVLYLWGKIKNLVSGKVDKETGKSLISDTEIARLKNVSNYDDTTVKSDITTMKGQIEALEEGTYDDTALRQEIAKTYETKANVKTHTDNTTVHITADERNTWNTSEANAKAYADGLATNYDAAGSATTAETNAKTYAKTYADGLAKNYDAKGSASTAETNAKAYADGLADNYDTKGSATTAETNAKSYADGLAKNYDKSGAATTAETNAKSYTDTEIEKVKAKMVAGMHYKGSVDTYADLPTKNEVGDMYNVKTASENNKAGDNVVWDGTAWDNQGGTIDLSGYVQETDIVAITNDEIDTITAS